MSNTYTWHVSLLETAPSENGLTDVVKVVHWTLQAADGVNTTSCYGSVAVGSPTPEHFTNYASLTESQVIGWLETALDVEQLKGSLDKTLQDLANPPIITLPLPWG